MKGVETQALVVAVTGTLIYFGAFGLYIRKMLSGTVVPNAATWTLWAALPVINAATYQAMTGDLIVSIQTYSAAITNLCVFFLALKRGKFRPLSGVDKVVLVLGLIAIAVWVIRKDATWSNMIIQACIFISIIPTWVSVWKNPGSESSLPWFLLASSYTFQIVAVFLLRKEWSAYVFHTNAGFVQLVVALLALRRPQKPRA